MVFRFCEYVCNGYRGSVLDDEKTKGERREEKTRRKRNMRVVGRNVKLLQDIINRRAKRLRKNRLS